MNDKEGESNRSHQIEASRRRFLKTAGKLASYTPPAMLLLMQPGLEAIAMSSGRPRGQRCDNGIGNGSDCLPNGLQKNGKDYLNNDDLTGQAIRRRRRRRIRRVHARKRRQQLRHWLR